MKNKCEHKTHSKNFFCMECGEDLSSFYIAQLDPKLPAVKCALQLHSYGLLNTRWISGKSDRDNQKRLAAAKIHEVLRDIL